MNENQTDNILRAYKQTNALIFVVGILLGSYTINGSGFYNFLAGVVAVIVVLYGAFQYYKIDGKIGMFFVLMAILWAIGYVLVYFKIFLI